jgi:hypothetical protein
MPRVSRNNAINPEKFQMPILLIILIVLLLGGGGGYYYGGGYPHALGGGLGTVLIVILGLWFFGFFARAL